MNPSVPFRTGGYVATKCSKCNLELGHTILAMVGPKIARVRCDTCGSEHAFHGDRPAAKAPSAASAPKPSGPTWVDLLAGRGLEAARRYSAREAFAGGDVIAHVSFGLGVVTADRGDKIDVTFRDATRTLVNGRAKP